MSERLKTIRLYGVLGKQFGRVHHLAVSSTREAIKAMSVVLPGFEKFIVTAHERGLAFAVFNGKRNIGEDELEDPTGGSDIRIAPIIQGSKQAGLFQIIVGVVLLVVGFFTGGTTWGPAMMIMGGAMAATGVITMLTTQATTASSGDSVTNKPSYSFNGPVNTEAQGNPVPLLYGELIVGSAVVSAGIYAEDQA